MSGWDAWLAYLKSKADEQDPSKAVVTAHSCGIYSFSDGSAWADDGLNCDATAITQIKNAITGGVGAQSSVTINGTKYLVLTTDTDEGLVLAKKGPGGFTAIKGSSGGAPFIIVSVYNDTDVSPGNNRNRTECCRNLIEGRQ